MRCFVGVWWSKSPRSLVVPAEHYRRTKTKVSQFRRCRKVSRAKEVSVQHNVGVLGAGDVVEECLYELLRDVLI